MAQVYYHAIFFFFKPLICRIDKSTAVLYKKMFQTLNFDASAVVVSKIARLHACNEGHLFYKRHVLIKLIRLF